MRRLLVVGGGRMGVALLGGMIRSGWAPVEELAVAEKLPQARDDLVRRFPGLNVLEAVESAEGVVIAVKPSDIEQTCRSLAALGCRRFLSIAAGVGLSDLESWLGAGSAVVRAMPNTPALLGAGASAISGGRGADEDDLAWAEGVLSSVGVVARLPERLLDAVTGLSGSGPAYVFLLAEALIDAGVMLGIDRDVARLLAVQTILGSGRLLAETGETPEVLRAAVTSPGGTTAAGLQVLEGRAVRAAVVDAVAAAATRSRELGEGH